MCLCYRHLLDFSSPEPNLQELVVPQVKQVTVAYLRENNTIPSRINIYSAYTAGLVAKKGQPWAKDSFDFLAGIMLLMTASTTMSRMGIETKSRLTTTTIVNEEEYLLTALNREKHVSIPED